MMGNINHTQYTRGIAAKAGVRNGSGLASHEVLQEEISGQKLFYLLTANYWSRLYEYLALSLYPLQLTIHP